MTEDEFVACVKYILSGRYVPIMEWKKYIQFSNDNNFELDAIFELIHFCVMIKKNNKIRQQYIMCCLQEYLYLNLKTKNQVIDYIAKVKRINLRPKASENKRATISHNYTPEELNSLFTKLEEVEL